MRRPGKTRSGPRRFMSRSCVYCVNIVTGAGASNSGRKVFNPGMQNASGLTSAKGLERITRLMAGENSLTRVFREILESLPIAIYTTDAQGRVTYFNSAAAK